MFHEIINVINSALPHVPWDAIAASGVISPLLVGVKKWFSVQSERVMISLVILTTMLTAAANYLIHVPTHDPSIIALQGAVLAFMTQPMYFFVVKPLMGFWRKQVQRAAELNLEVKSAAVPATGVPGSQDFKP